MKMLRFPKRSAPGVMTRYLFVNTLAKETIDVFHEEKNPHGNVPDLRVSRQDRSGGSVGRAQRAGHPQEREPPRGV
jgi:hypothetical protein